MNQATQTYWQQYWQDEEPPDSVNTWQFGVHPDKLANLVVNGIKTATCSALVFYKVENEPMPKVGEYNIILNGDERPVALTKTTEVTITPMNEVSEDFAISEGEGDRTYRYWWEVHEQFFKKE